MLKPAGHNPQLEAPVAEVALPGAQGVQAAAPAAENVPGRHAITAVLAAVGQKFPFVHAEQEPAPAALANVPPRHARHEVAPIEEA